MNKWIKYAFWSYFFAIVSTAIFGIIYLIRPEFMPYHSEAVGKAWQEVEPGIQILLLGLMKSNGAAMLGFFLAAAAILLKPFRSGEKWARIVFPIIGLLYSIAVLLITLYVKNNTGANTPWIAAAAGILLMLLGAFFSLLADGKTGDGRQ